MRKKIENILETFGINVKVKHAFEGFSSATYLLQVGAGTPVRSISRYRMDIANALNVPDVRVGNSLAMHNGESFLPVEAGVRSGETLYFDESKLEGSKIPIGVDNFGNTIVWDLDNHSTPHVLMGGATGSGKSVSLKSTIEYARLLEVESIFILDPKHEFKEYQDMVPFAVANEIWDIELALKFLVAEMDARVKNGCNEKILVIFDEFADAIANSRKGRELPNGEKSLEENMRLLLQKGRSTGIRVIAATQRASTKIVTGDLKVNFPVRICFRVPSATDSRVMIDENGAETLNGRGDGLMKSPEYNGVVRFQGFFYNK